MNYGYSLTKVDKQQIPMIHEQTIDKSLFLIKIGAKTVNLSEYHSLQSIRLRIKLST
jgi:hypothetical protein